jgi:hypothetical protein
MEWSDFTLSYMDTFKKNKYKLDNNSPLIKFIRSEKNNIIKFISNNKFKINHELLEKLNKTDIISFCKVKWVDTKAVINEFLLMKIFYKISWNNNNIYIASHTKNNINFKKIKLIIYIIEYLKYKTQINKSVNIYIVLTNLKKEFPQDNEIIDVKNVNTAYTDFKKNIIFIWRYEEYEKVLFHEIIHYFNLDCREVEYDTIIHTKHENYYEAVTDYQGIIYHLIFLSILKKISVKFLFKCELAFIRNQALIINERIKNNSIQQNTPAYSYYVLKYLLLLYLLKHYKHNNNYNKIFMKISKINLSNLKYTKINSSRMTLFQLV